MNRHDYVYEQKRKVQTEHLLVLSISTRQNVKYIYTYI
jgi:hypothetical protein